MPDFAIVDAHVRLYDPNRLNYTWIKRIPKLDRPHPPADYARLAADVAIEALVFVEVDAAPGEHLAEARFVEEQSRVEPRLRGMVASMPLEKGAAVEADLAEYAKLPRACGVRCIIERHHIDHAIVCLGFDRVMFGSDWPVSEVATTYRDWINLVDTVFAKASNSERRRLYRDNAISFYRL